MHETKEDPVTLRGGEVSDFIARLTTKAFIALFIILVLAVVQISRHGANSNKLILLAGSVLSGIAILAYALLVVWDAGRKRRGIIPMIIAFGGFLPYIFGCYLVFYEGFWRLRTLLNHFSVMTILTTLFFVFIGYLVVYGIYQISEFGRKVNEGKIIIE